MTKRLLRLLRTASLALLFAGTASAQTTGNVIGVVTDFSTGKPLAGVLVVATSSSLQGEQTAVSDAQGAYRFDLLPPGQYKLAAQLDTYKPFERSDIVVRIDKTIRANLSLTPEAVKLEEQVVKSGVAPVVNVGSAETGAVVSKEFIATVPVGRDFSSTAVVAPGARTDTYGVSFNGSTSPENGYVLDGMNIADPAYGTLGSNVLNNFVEQVDIKTSAFMPEYGRSSGGVINVVTKSGSNEFHGSVWGNYTPYSLSPAAKDIQVNATAIAMRNALDKSYNADFGAEVGGPIMKDKLWFYAGVAPVLRHNVHEKYLQYLSETTPGSGVAKTDASGFTLATPIPGTTKSYASDSNQYQMTGKLTYLVNSDNSITASVFAGPASDNNLVSTLQGTDSATTFNDTTNQLDANARYAGKFLDRHLIIEGVAGWHHQHYQDDPKVIDGVNQGSEASVAWYLPHSLTDFYSNLPSQCDPTATFTPCPTNRFYTGGYGYMDKINLDRIAARLSGSYLLSAAGQHNIKGGIDMERSYYDHWKMYSGGQALRERNTSLFGPVFAVVRGFGYVAPGTENVDPINGPAFTSQSVTSVTDSRAYYLQDSWQPIENLTLNGGVRWETQSMFKQGESNANMVINDNIAPRVQAIYDFTGQGRSKVSAHWGRYYENIPLDMGDRSFGGETQILTTRSYCTAASPNVTGANSPANCPVIPQGTYDSGTGQYVTFAPYGGTGAVPVAPDLKGQYTDQFGGSFEYEFMPDLSVGLEYRGTRLGRIIEDMSSNDGTDFFIANPTESKPWTITGYNGQPVVVNPSVATASDMQTLRQYQIAFPKPRRDYDGFTVQLRKNFSSHWLAEASYTYSVLRGDIAGLYRGEDGQLDPNITSEYDLAQLMSNHYGPLPADTPHQFKVFGAYSYDFSSRLSGSLGGALRAQSGTPINYLGAHPWYGNGQTFILPRGYGGRTPTLTNLDLKGQVRYVIRAPYAISFSVDVFNILNAQNATSVDNNYTYDAVLPIANASCGKTGAQASDPIAGAAAQCPALTNLRTVDGRPVTVNKNFGRPTAYQAPLSVRFGLALAF